EVQPGHADDVAALEFFDQRHAVPGYPPAHSVREAALAAAPSCFPRLDNNRLVGLMRLASHVLDVCLQQRFKARIRAQRVPYRIELEPLDGQDTARGSRQKLPDCLKGLI